LIPPVTAFDDPVMGEILGLFQNVPLDGEEHAISINWSYLERQLGMSRLEVERLLRRASARGLLQRMEIDYDHVKWMRQSADKGVLLIMACVERRDLVRPPREYLDGVVNVVDEIASGVVNRERGQFLREVVVVPNGHLDPRSDNKMPWTSVLAILEAIPPVLEAGGFHAHLNSFGHAKILELAINAHPLGYVLRTV
jgi:hypothetical protein